MLQMFARKIHLPFHRMIKFLQIYVCYVCNMCTFTVTEFRTAAICYLFGSDDILSIFQRTINVIEI